MANKSVLELAVGTGQWDSGLKKAKQALDNFTSAQGGLQQALEKDNGDMTAFVKMMANMDSTAKTSKQQLREMTNVLTDFTTTYRTLTDEQKASPFGQEMAKAIQSLTERAGVLRDAMEDVQLSVRNAASDTRLFDQVAQGMSVATAGFQGLTGAGKLLGIEMGNDVEVIAKLQAAMAVTNSLTTIQTALQKQSALMQGVQAVQASAAAAAQTALAAATGNATLAQKAFNVVANMNPYVALATAIVACGAALYAFSSNSKDAEKAQKALNLELDHTKTALDQIDKDTDFSVGIAEAAGKSWDAIHKLRLEAARTKLQLADLNYDRLFESGASPEQLKQAQEMQKQAWDNVMKILNEGTIREIQKRNGTGPFAKGKGGSGNKSVDTNYAADSIMAQEKEVQRLTDAWNRASGAMRAGILEDLEKAKAKLEAMKATPMAEIGDVVVTGTLPPLMKMQEVLKQLNEELLKAKTPEAYQEILADIKAINEEIDTFKGKSNGNKNKKKSYEDLEKFNKDYSQIVGGVSSIASGIQQMGVEMPKELQSILGVLTGMSTIMSGIVAILTLIDAKESIQAATAPLPFFARGGVVHAASGFMVPGNNFSGDLVPAYLNSGELVLNKFQQQALAGTLENGGMKNISISGHLEGETIALSVDRWGKRSGKGELAFFKNQ